MNKPLPRTTIRQMPPPHPKNRFRYCFEMSHHGGEQRAELEAWCQADPVNRRWGNMGYVECNLDSDAIEFITTWGINWRHKTKSTERELIGYTEREEGFYPLYSPAKGSIVTHTFILCRYCGGSIYHCMGPRYDAVCLTCYGKDPDER